MEQQSRPPGQKCCEPQCRDKASPASPPDAIFIVTEVEAITKLSLNKLIMTTTMSSENDDRSGADQFSPTEAAIAVVAYRCWTERDGPVGSPEEDWFRAEREIKHSRTPGSVL